MASGRRQLAALLLIVALAQSASATYVGYALGCTGDTTINCGPNMLGSVTLTTVKSCARVSVGCYSGYSGSTCGGKDGSCPKCVDNGNSITLTCSSSNCPASNPRTYDATGVCGDPHFAAPGGIFFDWHGERDQDFSIISDTNFQLNAHFIGERTDTKSIEHGTWMQEVAMGYKENNEVHFLTVGIDQEKEFEAADVLYFTYDGEEIFVSSGTAEYKWTSPDNKVTISRAPHMRAKALVKIDGLFEATFFPRIESRIQLEPLGKYLDMDMENLSLSRHAHGVLGQMFRPDAVERKNAATNETTGHEFLVEGATKDYRVSSLTAYDSTFNQFNLAAGLTVKSFNIIEDGASLSRKMLSAGISSISTEDGAGEYSVRCSQDSGRLVCVQGF